MNIEIVKAVRYSNEPTIFCSQVSYLFFGTVKTILRCMKKYVNIYWFRANRCHKWRGYFISLTNLS